MTEGAQATAVASASGTVTSLPSTYSDKYRTLLITSAAVSACVVLLGVFLYLGATQTIAWNLSEGWKLGGILVMAGGGIGLGITALVAYILSHKLVEPEVRLKTGGVPRVRSTAVDIPLDTASQVTLDPRRYLQLLPRQITQDSCEVTDSNDFTETVIFYVVRHPNKRLELVQLLKGENIDTLSTLWNRDGYQFASLTGEAEAPIYTQDQEGALSQHKPQLDLMMLGEFRIEGDTILVKHPHADIGRPYATVFQVSQKSKDLVIKYLQREGYTVSHRKHLHDGVPPPEYNDERSHALLETHRNSVPKGKALAIRTVDRFDMYFVNPHEGSLKPFSVYKVQPSSLTAQQLTRYLNAEGYTLAKEQRDSG